jgi:hypothetical protein
MACFIAPLTMGIVVKIIEKIFKATGERLKLNILSNMLLGGSLALMVEHAWHGEITVYPPFLTAASSPANMATAIGEIYAIGLLMALGVAGLWAGGLLFYMKSLEISGKTGLKTVVSLSR